MSEDRKLRLRRSLLDIQNDYNSGKDRAQLENLMRAWKGIKELPPDDPRSFFTLGGYHGAPFRGAGWGNAQYWGGYCNHGNVLFPTWHRAYLLKLEDALRTMPGCQDVTLPFWDETSDDSIKNGIPSALTAQTFVLDGKTIPNPLRSFVFTANVEDSISPDPVADYSKPKGYETVRYPLSGLRGPNDIKATEEHNAKYPDPIENTKLLNQNIIAWLTSQIVIKGKPIQTHVKHRYELCLNAPNYTVFSNTTSSTQWRDMVDPTVMSLEEPHNDIHLAVGGVDVPTQDDAPIEGANGDMGENDTAGLDPIFFFHHCFVDRVFWLWQVKNNSRDVLEIIAQYPGTNSVDAQGPTPGTPPNSWLTMDSPLDPFRHGSDGSGRPYTSSDCVNIEKQLGYTYGPGSLEDALDIPAATAAASNGGIPKAIRIRGIQKGRIRGSFLVSAFARIDGQRVCIGTKAVLSRWNVENCANCQTHLETKAVFPLLDPTLAALTENQVEIEIRTRSGLLGDVRPKSIEAESAERAYYMEIR